MNDVNPNDYEEWSSLAPWDVFFSDLELTVHHTLTEPTCPTAKIAFELPERAGTHVVAQCLGNTIEEAIARAVAVAKERLPALTEKRRAEIEVLKRNKEAQKCE